MVKKVSKVILVVLLLISLQGCATIISLVSLHDPVHPFTYGGTRRHVNTWGRNMHAFPVLFNNTIIIFDFPFSLVLDTVFLPLTVPVDLYIGDEYFEQFEDYPYI